MTDADALALWAQDLRDLGLDPGEVAAYEATLPAAARASTVLGPPPFDPLQYAADLWRYVTEDTVLASLTESATLGARKLAADPRPVVNVESPTLVIDIDWRAVAVGVGAVAAGVLVLDLVVLRGAGTGRAIDGAAAVATRGRR